jgi:hypothetical protein
MLGMDKTTAAREDLWRASYNPLVNAIQKTLKKISSWTHWNDVEARS